MDVQQLGRARREIFYKAKISATHSLPSMRKGFKWTTEGRVKKTQRKSFSTVQLNLIVPYFVFKFYLIPRKKKKGKAISPHI